MTKNCTHFVQFNIYPAVNQIKSALDRWELLHFFLWGKANIIKMIVLPWLLYTCVVPAVEIPGCYFQKLIKFFKNTCDGITKKPWSLLHKTFYKSLRSFKY